MASETPRVAKAQFLHDGAHLYIRLSETMATANLVTKQIFEGDDWELFFSAARDHYPCRQIGVNPKGDYAEVPHGEPEWRSGVTVASAVTASDWTVTLAFPLAQLLPGGVKPGQPFCANFCRGTPAPGVLLAWSPNFVRNFQKLDRLGELVLE